MKIIKWYKVFWNSIVLKENEKFVTLHNLWLLNWDHWTYLETYFLKRDFDETKFLEAWDEAMTEMIWELDEKFLKFFNEQSKTENEILENVYDRSSDFIVKKFVDRIKEKMNISYSFEEWLEILNELPEHSNNFSHIDIHENFDKLDVQALLSNPEVDSYVKDCLRDIVDNDTVNNDLDDANKSFFKFREIEKKKDLWDRIKEWAKKVWKVTLIWGVLAWLALSFTAPHVNAAELTPENIEWNVISQDISQISTVQQATKENLVFKWINSKDWSEINLDNIEWLTIFKSDWTIINYWSLNFKSAESANTIFWVRKSTTTHTSWALWITGNWASYTTSLWWWMWYNIDLSWKWNNWIVYNSALWAKTSTSYKKWIELEIMDLKWIELKFNWEDINLNHWSNTWLWKWEVKMIIQSWWKTYKVDNDNSYAIPALIATLSFIWLSWALAYWIKRL